MGKFSKMNKIAIIVAAVCAMGTVAAKEGIYVGADVGRTDNSMTMGEVKLGYDFGGIRAELSQGKYKDNDTVYVQDTNIFYDEAVRDNADLKKQVDDQFTVARQAEKDYADIKAKRQELEKEGKRLKDEGKIEEGNELERQAKEIYNGEEKEAAWKQTREVDKWKEGRDKYNEIISAAPLSTSVKYKLDSDVTMATMYYDFYTGTRITPFVMGGLGLAHNTVTGQLNHEGYTGTEISKTKTQLAWQVGAGIGYSVTESLDVDVMFRYSDRGNVAINGEMDVAHNGGSIGKMGVHHDVDLTSKDVTIGLRYTF